MGDWMVVSMGMHDYRWERKSVGNNHQFHAGRTLLGFHMCGPCAVGDCLPSCFVNP